LAIKAREDQRKFEEGDEEETYFCRDHGDDDDDDDDFYGEYGDEDSDTNSVDVCLNGAPYSRFDGDVDDDDDDDEDEDKPITGVGSFWGRVDGSMYSDCDEFVLGSKGSTRDDDEDDDYPRLSPALLGQFNKKIKGSGANGSKPAVNKIVFNVRSVALGKGLAPGVSQERQLQQQVSAYDDKAEDAEVERRSTMAMEAMLAVKRIESTLQATGSMKRKRELLAVDGADRGNALTNLLDGYDSSSSDDDDDDRGGSSSSSCNSNGGVSSREGAGAMEESTITSIPMQQQDSSSTATTSFDGDGGGEGFSE
jgi:hypothetical protein